MINQARNKHMGLLQFVFCHANHVSKSYANIGGVGGIFFFKEAGMLEAERTVQMALAKAALLDDLQNKNQELGKQIEICQEENKILDKMHRQRVYEVEKLTQTVRELEGAVLARGAVANAVHEYEKKVQELNVPHSAFMAEAKRKCIGRI
ncbi:hypothetical protein ACS0TY_030697 [Phlomoides rotata]